MLKNSTNFTSLLTSCFLKRQFASAASAASAIPAPAPVWEEQPVYTKIFINNEWKSSVRKKKFPTICPANGQKIADVEEGGKEDVDLAVQVTFLVPLELALS
ncbi:unnamed protein product [Gongylonema pulchrum]|uniref:Succinate-semialdehyde dehydrogenase, mitochondrial n=1 Tax=Gongylonema pulchrum TaxID=637853 RepID=A0A183CW99_9BILA|nr:unnamed protein product [Gongylonema pulchrum]